MANFNAPLNRQLAHAVGRLVTRHHVANIGHQGWFGQVAAPVDAGDVKVGFVGATNPVAHGGHFAVGHHFDGLLQVD